MFGSDQLRLTGPVVEVAICAAPDIVVLRPSIAFGSTRPALRFARAATKLGTGRAPRPEAAELALHLSDLGIGSPHMSNVHVVSHPLVQHKLTLMRDKTVSTKGFRQLLNEIGMLLAYEVTRDLPLELIEVETPLAKTMQPTIAGKKLVFAPIRRAGTGFLDGMLNLVPSAAWRTSDSTAIRRHWRRSNIILRPPPTSPNAW